MLRGLLHAFQDSKENIFLIFGLSAPDGVLVAMKPPRRFTNCAALVDFLKEQIEANEEDRNGFLSQLVLARHATMNEVKLSEEQCLRLGF
jgi:hypothetical protein